MRSQPSSTLRDVARRALAAALSLSLALGTTPAYAWSEAVPDAGEGAQEVVAGDCVEELQVSDDKQTVDVQVESGEASTQEIAVGAENGEEDTNGPNSEANPEEGTSVASSVGGLTAQSVIGDDYPYKNYPMEGYDPWLFVYRNCTSFVAWRLNNTNGVEFTNWYGGVQWGWAGNWGNAARSLGITVDSNPAVGAVAWESGGHVAWVAEVGSGTVTIEEYNWGTDGSYHTRTVPTSRYAGFIHIKDLSSDRQPVGNFDIAEGGAGTIHVKGWAYDPDVSSSSVEVHVYVNGSYAFAIPASGSRPDVNSAYGISGNHGFDYTFSTTARGNVKVAAYAINNNGSGGNPPIRKDGGASEFTVNVTSPTTRNGTPTDLPSDTAFILIPECSHHRAVKLSEAANGASCYIQGGDEGGYSNNFRFKFQKHSSGSYGIQWVTNSRYYMHVSGAPNRYMDIVGWETYGNNNSLWVPERTSDGLWSFRNSYYGTYLDLSGARDELAAGLVHWPGNNSSAQKFHLMPVNKSLADSDVEVTCPDRVAWTGSAVRPAITVSYLGVTLKEGEDYTVSYSNNTNAGTATATITGVGGTPGADDLRGYRGYYTGSRTLSFSIDAGTADISGATVSAIADQTYTGKAIKPAVTVKFGLTTLKSGTDYTLSYKSNTNVGTATVTITGKGNYTGTKSVTFKIVKAAETKTDISKATVSAIADQTYTGKAIEPTPTVKVGSATLKSGTDYTLSYKSNTNVGTATVTITGKGNYTGTKSVTFKIVRAVVATQEMFRLYNPNSGEHFYTASAGERDALVYKHGWKYEGVGWVAPVESSTPVYRLYNAKAGDHHYTTDETERNVLVYKHGWTDEGIGWYSDDAMGVPLYRQYNPNAKTGSHNYTTSTTERDVLVNRYGWVDEGIGWYGVKQ